MKKKFKDCVNETECHLIVQSFILPKEQIKLITKWKESSKIVDL